MSYITHQGWGTKEYRVWADIKTRCFNKNFKQYADYGGRGITMCEEWRADFAAFLRDVGNRPKEGKWVIDRIDNDGNYEPGNVRWATRQQSELNKRPGQYDKTMREKYGDDIFVKFGKMSAARRRLNK